MILNFFDTILSPIQYWYLIVYRIPVPIIPKRHSSISVMLTQQVYLLMLTAAKSSQTILIKSLRLKHNSQNIRRRNVI